MKIIIPVDKSEITSPVSNSFGRAVYFIVYDSDKETFTVIDNEATNSHGGAGIKAAQTVVDQKADVLITPRCGENAAKILNMANIVIYQSMEGNTKANIDYLRAGTLSKLTTIHEGFHNHGAK